MSTKDMARRTEAEIAFNGTDITSSIQSYLLSVTYTDNEEDETDDLQIRLQDRDDIWLTKWLNDVIDTASSVASFHTSSGGGSKSYKVTPAVGLNVRSGPGTSHSKLGALVCGTIIEVSAIENGWASIRYSGQTAYVSAAYIKEVDNSSNEEQQRQTLDTALKIQAVFVRKNWHGDGKDKALDCGQFELDAIDASGPPSTITLKATSLPYSAQIRQTKKSRAWEACHLSSIVSEIAAANGMVCLCESANDPYYERAEQFKVSDIAFLSSLCHDAGISLKSTNNILVLFDQATYEAKDAVVTLKKGEGSYIKYKLTMGTADSQYSSCRVSYSDPVTGASIEAIAQVEDYKADAKNNQRLEVTAKVTSIAEAKALAEKRLRLHNKYARAATITLPGDPDLVAGVTVMLEGWGAWSGKYIVKQARHTVDGSGYTVQITLRRVLEGY